MSEDPLAAVRAIADAVLYEGYVLYPYRASSDKNQVRWQFGVLMPPGYVAVDPSERTGNRTELVLEARPGALLRIQLRFLHLQHRSGGDLPDWDEAQERQIDVDVAVDQLRHAPVTQEFSVAAQFDERAGVTRETAAVQGAIVVDIAELPGPYGALQLGVSIENRTESGSHDRDDALRCALVSTHTLYALDGGRFLSMVDPPEWAAALVASCRNDGTWPVLAGSESVVLSSPIILGDHPEIAPESPGQLYDSTEIDEILTLRTMTLTDEEKAEARRTDPRAAAVIDQVDQLPPEHLDRLHGALRYLRTVTGDREPAEPSAEPATLTTPDTPWWDPGSDRSVSPDTDAIVIAGVPVRRGSKVLLRPGRRRTDAQDAFLHGRAATVECVLFDVDGQQHLGVIPDDDPDMAELQRWHGRFLYFSPDEVEPLPQAVR